MRPLTDNERAYVEFRKAMIAADQEEAERMASTQLWETCKTEDWCGDAARALAEVNGVRAAREAQDQSRWQSRVAHAVAETYVELDPDG